MANRYWVGGTANWDGTAGTKWSDTSGGTGGFSVPTTADDVFFDSNSGTNTITIATGNTGAKSINCTGFTGTIAGTANITVAGSITLVSGQTYTHTGTVTITGTGTLTTAGKSFSGVTVNGSSITVTLGDALNVSTRYVIVTSGTLNTSASNYSLTTAALSVNGGTLTLNASTVTLTDNSIPFTRTSGTVNAGTSQINISSLTPDFAGGGQTFYNVTFTQPFLSYGFIRGQNTFNNLTFTGKSVGSGISTVYLANNQTVNGTLTVTAGADATCRTLFRPGSGSLSNKTLTCAAVSLTDVDFYNITGAGAASWTGTRIGNATGNSGITFTAAKTVYWNLATGGNWSSTGWALTSGGTPAANNFPLPQDTAVFESTGLNSGATITYNYEYVIGSINMSARTFSPTNTMTIATGTNSPLIVGNWTNGTGSFITGSSSSLSGNAMIFGGIGVSQTLTSGGRIIPVRMTIDAPSSTLTLQDNLELSASAGSISPNISTISLINGTLDLNGKTVTFTGLSSQFGVYSGTKNITFNGGTLSISGYLSAGPFDNTAPTGFTTTAGTGVGTIRANNGGNFIGGGSTYNCTLDQAGSNTLTISGSNTFNNITNTYGATGATAIWFTAGTTQTVQDFTASGTSGKVLTIRSTGAGSAATLSKSSGTVSVDYVSIRDITATGGASWYAGANSTNVSGNTGWIFSAPPQPAFLMFF